MLTALQQSTLLVVSVLLILFVRSQIRRGTLSFLLGLMWVSIAVIGIVSSALIPFVGRVSTILGLLPAAILAGAASAMLGGVALVLSLRVSSLEEQHQDLVIAMARSTPVCLPEPATGIAGIVAIVPALNEVATVAMVVRELQSIGLAVLVVSDGSTDGTAEVARGAGASVLDLPLNLGVGGALRAGFQVARSHGYQTVIQCDADGQHSAEAVAALLEEQQSAPVDLLIGSRFLAPRARRDEPFVRRTAMVILSALASRAGATRITDATSGLRIIRSPLLDELARAMPTHYLGDTFEVNVMAGRSGYRIREVPTLMRPRAFGSSTASTAAAFRLTIRGILVVLLRAQRRVAVLPRPDEPGTGAASGLGEEPR